VKGLYIGNNINEIGYMLETPKVSSTLIGNNLENVTMDNQQETNVKEGFLRDYMPIILIIKILELRIKR
jgi:hypothetical protein